jgi:hypothetical protein
MAFGASLLASATWAAEPDADALITRLERATPARIAFAEARFSPLLERPIFVSGQLGYQSRTSLERIVTSPFSETTAIHGESVSVQRAGESPRTFALRRTPELRGLLAAFGGLLAGDGEAVKRDFGVTASGSDEAWALELLPRDARVARRLTRMLVTGSGNEPRCFSTFTVDGGATVLMLGTGTDTELAPDATLDSLLDRCRAE